MPDEFKISVTRIKLLAILVTGIILTYFSRKFLLDDALIYYRYIQNCIDGKGLVYNPGEYFNALTSPLYTYLSVLISAITRETVTTQLILSGFLLVSSVVTLMVLFNRNGQAAAGTIAILIIISSKYFYTVIGMETSLFVLLSLLCIYLYVRKDFLLLTVFSALLILTRGEGIFLAVVIGYFILKENRSEYKTVYLLYFALILALNYIFNYYYYGKLLPHTLTAKISQGDSGLWGHKYQFISNFPDMFYFVFGKNVIFFASLVILAVIGLAGHYKERFSIILISNAVLLSLFYTLINVPSYHWYYSIHFLSLYIFAAYGVIDLYNLLGKKLRKTSLKTALIILFVIYPLYCHCVSVYTIYQDSVAAGNRPAKYTAAGLWIRDNTSKDAKVACIEIGHLGWYSQRYIIDILGLVSPMNADFLGRREFDKWFEYYKPDYVVMNNPPWDPGHESSIVNLLEKGYFREIENLNIDGIKILKATYKKEQ